MLRAAGRVSCALAFGVFASAAWAQTKPKSKSLAVPVRVAEPPETLRSLLKPLQASAIPSVAKYVGETYRWPSTFHVTVNSCSASGATASYMEESEDVGSQGYANGEILPAGILYCWELVEAARKAIEAAPSLDADTKRRLLSDALALMLAHTMGHAFIDQLKLPAIYQTEEFADKVGIYLLVKAGMKQAGINAALVTFLAGLKGAFEGHAPDRERLMSMACWAYGANHEDESLSKEYDAVAKQWDDGGGVAKADCNLEWVAHVDGPLEKVLKKGARVKR